MREIEKYGVTVRDASMPPLAPQPHETIELEVWQDFRNSLIYKTIICFVLRTPNTFSFRTTVILQIFGVAKLNWRYQPFGVVIFSVFLVVNGFTKLKKSPK